MAGERRPRRKGQQGFGPGVCTVFCHPHPALSSRGPDPEPGARPRADTSSAHWALQEAHGLGSCHFAEGGTGGPGAHSVQGAGGLLLASHTCLWALLGFAPVCVALGCVWPGEALHTPPASRPDARPSPWAALEDCGVRGCGRARVRGPASPTPTAPSLGAWEAE